VSSVSATLNSVVGEAFMENEDQEFWRALLANRNLRSRFIRDLEIQAISTRSAEDLAVRYRQEEMLPRKGGRAASAGIAVHSAASSRSW
jgi:hypothetical protein